MPWNGSGSFDRLYSWVADKVAGLPISSSRMDADTDDIVSQGLGLCLTRDGQGSAQADQPMNGFRHTGVGAANDVNQYGTVDQIQKNSYLYAVAGGTANALTAAFGIAHAALTDGRELCVRALLANTSATPTFQPDGLTAKTITKFGGKPLLPGDIAGPDHALRLRYDSNVGKWEILNPATSGVPWAVAAGTADAITAAYTPAIGTLYDGLTLAFRASAANATTTPTFAADATTAHTITKQGGAALAAGDIPAALAECVVRYNLAHTRFELLNPAAAAPTTSPVILAHGGVNTGSGILLALDLSGYSAYKRIVIQLDHVNPGATPHDVLVEFSTDAAATWLASGYSWSVSSLAAGTATGGASASDTKIHLELASPSSSYIDGTIELTGINTSAAALLTSRLCPAAETFLAGGTNSTGSINGIRISSSGGTITAGTYRVIGYV